MFYKIFGGKIGAKLGQTVALMLILGACVYAESPDGRYGAIRLPTVSHSTSHKTVTVNTPAGTVVHITENVPTIIYRDSPRRDCSVYPHRRTCH